MTAFTSLHGAPVVDDGVEAEQISNECRDAALTFLRGVTMGWDKIDLALWLTGDYARATRHVPRGERVHSLGDRDVDAEALDALLDKTRAQLVACFEQAALDGNLACAEDCLTRVLLRKVTAPDGGVLYVPVDAQRMRGTPGDRDICDDRVEAEGVLPDRRLVEQGLSERDARSLDDLSGREEPGAGDLDTFHA